MRHRYLITGAQGFVGRYLVHCLLARSEENTILGVGRSTQQDSHFLHSLSCGGRSLPALLPDSLHVSNSPRYRYLSLDLLSDNLIDAISEFHPTAVIHLAASLRGFTDEAILQNNVQSTENLLNALLASRTKLEVLLLASSGGVYGRQEMQPISENAPVAPIDQYAKSKFASEAMVQSFARRSGTPVDIARIFNVLGPGQDELHVAGRLVSNIGTILSGAIPAVIRTRSLESTRDFLDVRDVSTALALILEQNHGGIYNVGSGVETGIADLVDLFIRAADLRDVARIESDFGAIDPIPRHVAKVDKLASTGFGAAYTLAFSCCDMLTYYRQFILPSAAI